MTHYEPKNSLTISKESSEKSAAASCTCATRTGPSGATTRPAPNRAGPGSRHASDLVLIMSMERTRAQSWIVFRVSSAIRTIAVSEKSTVMFHYYAVFFLRFFFPRVYPRIHPRRGIVEHHSNKKVAS